MSYVRVIERLEKQGERKKELRQQKAEQKAAKAAALEAKRIETEKENEFKIKSNSQKSDSSETATNNQQADQEIEKIIDQAKNNPEKVTDKSKFNSTTNMATATATNMMMVGAENTEKVKSPDFSFVDVSIRPRQTLNLLQRNLSSPSYSMQANDINSRLECTASEPQQVFQPALLVSSQQQQATLFNPKKRWLKCSEATNNTTISCPSDQSMISPATTAANESIFSPTLNVTAIGGFAQPPKKRRHMFGGDEQENSVDIDFNNNETSNSECSILFNFFSNICLILIRMNN